MKRGVSDMETDVVIVGGGIVGTTLHHMLGYVKGDISSVLVERQNSVGELNSEETQNSQTLHEGDIESNYNDIKKIRSVHAAANLYKSFLLDQGHNTSHLYKKMGKMLLGVGQKEVELVTKRYERLTLQEKMFPHNHLLNKDALEIVEPYLIDDKRKNGNEPVVAYYNKEGLAVDFGATCETLVDITNRTRGELGQVVLGSGVKEIMRVDSSGQLFDVELEDGRVIRSKAVVVSAGGYTPILLKEMGYGENIGILSIAGNYYRVKVPSKLRVIKAGTRALFNYENHNPLSSVLQIRNKVYTVQKEGLPFAALHVDPEVDNPEAVRLGPTAFGIPYLEKKKWTSFFDYMGIINVNHDYKSFVNIMSNEVIRTYVFRNFKYLIPIYGKWLFLKEARKIIPGLAYGDIEKLNGFGGTRPQIVDRTTHALNFGEAKVFGKNENLIFNITPSPGASTAFGNAYNDVQSLLKMDYFAQKFEFDYEKYNTNFKKLL